MPLLKSTETWTLTLAEIGYIANTGYGAKESPHGLTYEDYLGVLLLLRGEKRIAYHALDVMEATLRKQTNNDELCLDQYFVQAEVEACYQYNSVFYKGITPWKRSVTSIVNYSYH